MTTAYELLGVEPNADDTTINAAFRRAAKECHPDLNKGDRGGERLRLIIAARATLISLRRLDRDRSKSSHPSAQPIGRARSSMLAGMLMAAVGLSLLLMPQPLEPTRAIGTSQTGEPLHPGSDVPALPEKGPRGALAASADKPPLLSEVVPSFDVVYADERGRLVAAGRGKAGWIVRLKRGTQTLGEATADEHNEWVLILQTPLPPGSHPLSLLAIDPAGQRGISGQSGITLSIARRPAT